MSTQSTQSVPFTFTQPQQAFRLLELPPDVLQLLRSSEGPMTLKIKSSTFSPVTPISKTSINGVEQQTSTVHLVTPLRSYQIRQVNTSNSVFVATASNTMPQVSEEPDKGPENVTSSSLTAIAQVDSILELHAVSYSAEEILAKLLPVWSVDTTASSVVSKQTRKEVLAEIPLPDRQLDTACLNLLAFDNQSDDAAIVRPDAKSALKAWSDIVTIAIESSIDLSSFFYPSTLLNIPGPQQPHPHSAALINLRSAILQYLTYVPPSDASDSLLPINLDEKVWLQKDKLLRWTGITLLASLRSRKDYEPEENLTFGDIKNDLIAIDDFTTQWLDLLPEAWRQDVQLSLLPVVEEGKGKMKLNISQDQWVEMSKNIDALVVETPSSTAKVTTSGTATAAIGTGNKRKWHEKFKAERDARVAAAAAKKR